MSGHEQSNKPAAFLTVNVGSTSIKFALLDSMPPHGKFFDGVVDGIGLGIGRFHVEENGNVSSRRFVIPDSVTAAEMFLEWLGKRLIDERPMAIGHRVVYGGNAYRDCQEISDALLDDLFAVASFDTEHLPQEIRLIDTLRRNFPDARHIACFDTAFHRAMPKVARMLPIPRKYIDQGVMRLGFHGLSCAFLMRELGHQAGPVAAAGKIILAHLGGGCSVTAVSAGQSVDTSMGLTPGGGIMMAARSGDIDPGLAWRLRHDHQVSAAQFNHMVNAECGLYGVSAISGDLGVLLARDEVSAVEAVELFCYQTRKQICAMAGVLGGIETLVFSGGCGEHLAALRSQICTELAFLGIEIDESLNSVNAGVISGARSTVTVRVIHTDEQWMIAHEMCDMLERGTARGLS